MKKYKDMSQQKKYSKKIKKFKLYLKICGAGNYFEVVPKMIGTVIAQK